MYTERNKNSLTKICVINMLPNTLILIKNSTYIHKYNILINYYNINLSKIYCMVS